MGKSGVNPANGIVLYYHLPELKNRRGAHHGDQRRRGQTRADRYSSKKDSLFSEWEGGPSEEPTLSTNKGLNRFVWDLRYPTMAGIPGTYFENSFAGHKASPGKYEVQP